jgi:hypothetical protein
MAGPKRASHCNSAAPDVRGVHATGSESLLLARYGQNNPAIALGRKSWLFAGSERGADRAAAMTTLYDGQAERRRSAGLVGRCAQPNR